MVISMMDSLPENPSRTWFLDVVSMTLRLVRLNPSAEVPTTSSSRSSFAATEPASSYPIDTNDPEDK